MTFVEHLRTSIELLPSLAKFAFGMTLIIVIPRLSRRVRLPEAVGLLLSGVIFGPHVLDVFPREHPVGEFFAELGMLLLMFFAGLEINLELFRQQITRSVLFGVATTTLPLLLATLVMLWLGYGLLTAIVVGSLVASHTMLGSTIVARLGLRGREPIVVTYGATMVSDTLSLLVFAVCVPLYASGFSASGLALQVVEIVVFVPAVLFGLGRLGARLLRKLEDEEETYFIVMLVILAVTALLAQLIDLPGIVGTFLAGLAVNAAVKDKPAKGKLEFLGNSLFIPTFFAVTGFLIDPFVLGRGLANDFFLATGLDRRARRRQVDRGRSGRPRIRLRAGGAQDNVVAHAAATRGDAGGNARCIQDSQCGRPAAGRRPDRQQRSGDRGGHGDPGTGADPAFRTPHVRHTGVRYVTQRGCVTCVTYLTPAKKLTRIKSKRNRCAVAPGSGCRRLQSLPPHPNRAANPPCATLPRKSFPSIIGIATTSSSPRRNRPTAAIGRRPDPRSGISTTR